MHRWTFTARPSAPELLEAVLDAVRAEDGIARLGEVRFDQARFSGDATFDGVLFSAFAWFIGAQFSQVALFRRVQFSGLALFGEAQFSGGALFVQARFDEYAHFSKARFSGVAWFLGAQFGGDIGVSGTQFDGEARFDKARFKLPGTFGPLMAGRLLLDQADFDGAMVVEAVASEVSCVDARFAEAATLRLRYADIALDGTVFAKPSTVAFAQDTFKGVDSTALFDETTVRQDGRAAKPRLVSLRRVDTSTLTLADLDLQVCFVRRRIQP